MAAQDRSKIHICLNLDNDPRWHAGKLYIHNLIRALNALPADERENIKLSVLAEKRDHSALSDLGRIDEIYTKNLLLLSWLKLVKFSDRFLPLRFLNLIGIDFLYPTNLTANNIIPWGGWIPDFQHIHLPHLFTQEEIAYRNKRNGHLASAAAVIILSSKDAENDFHRLYPERADRTRVLQFVSHQDPSVYKSTPESVLQKYQLPAHYWIVCNQIWKHKDHITLVKALAQLRDEGLQPVMVWTGATDDYRNPSYFEELKSLIEVLGLASQIRILGFISREDQVQLIRASSGIVQPSLFEGWSTVVEDGKALGKPMVVSDLAVHQEQQPSHSYFFKKGNPSDLAQQFKKLMLEPKGFDPDREAKALLDNQQRQKVFGWSFLSIVRETLSKLRQ